MSLAIEGKFSEEGLLAMTQGEDTTTAMAKALVDGLADEGVEQVWSKLNQKNISDYREEVKLDGWLFSVDPESFLKKWETTRPKMRRRKVYRDPNQLSLFDDL